MKKLFAFAIVAALGACSGLTQEERDQTRENLFATVNAALVQLQTLDLAKVEVDPQYRQIAAIGCVTAQALIPLAVPYLNKGLAVDPEKAVTIDEAAGIIRDICTTVQTILVDKAPAPIVAPLPVPSPGT